MALSKIELQNFRNHKHFTAHIPQMIYIHGDNGAGKTSLTESIYLLLTLKTFRHDNIADIKMFGETYLRIKGEFSSENIDNAVYFHRDKRTVMIDGAEQQNLSEYIYMLPAICYSPGFESLFSQQHIERRQFLDRMIFYTEPAHLYDIRQYNALLARKRAALDKEIPDEELISVLNERALPLSETISGRRQAAVRAVNEQLAMNPMQASAFMPGMNLTLNISTLRDRDDKKEINAGRPLYGAHKDLLYLKQGERTVEKFQSFGQKKAALLFLLYNFAIRVEEYRKCGIIVLLDDFEAGLDVRRCEILSELFLSGASEKRQLFLTGLNVRHYKGAETLALTV